MKFVVHTDGASRGNPGHSAASLVIQSEDGVMWAQDHLYLGLATNNQAEYTAVKLAMERLLKDFSHKLPSEVNFYADSQLVIQQLKGEYRIKNMELKKIYDEIKLLEKQLGVVSYHYIPREQNVLADKLANKAIDNHLYS